MDREQTFIRELLQKKRYINGYCHINRQSLKGYLDHFYMFITVYSGHCESRTSLELIRLLLVIIIYAEESLEYLPQNHPHTVFTRTTN